MATNILDAFLITFGIDAREFSKGEREVRDGNKRLSEDSKRTFDSMESQSKGLGVSIKGVRNEVIGLGLAFMGARSITGMIASMATGAATADRLGQTLGMSTKQVWAWRQAMRSVGGQAGDADAALQAVQGMRMNFRMGQMDAGTQGRLGRLGVTGSDLKDSDPGTILRKISAAQDKMDPQLFASLLQQVGLNGPTTYFLMKGQASVDQLLKQFEGSADEQEALAKKTEDLQVQMADLNTKIQGVLVPVLLRLADAAEKIVSILPGGSTPKTHTAANGRKVVFEDTWFGGLFNVYADDGKTKPSARPHSTTPERGGAMPSASPTGGPNGKGRTRAERNNNPGNIEDGAFAKRQPGYAGTDGRFAKFATAQQGFEAMVRLLNGSGYRGQGRDTIMSILKKYAPSSDNNNLSAYASNVERQTGFNRNQHLNQMQIMAVAKAMAKHEGYRGDIHIGQMHVNTPNAQSFGRDLRAKTRRQTVAKADQGVNP